MSTTTGQLRKTFLEYFCAIGHNRQKSSSLIPTGDDTVMFSNSGMIQFKDFFLGIEIPKNKNLVSCQKCLRVGGKHNDLENVGKTARHHTFFEMLGNFSFGGYFKEEALSYAWKFITETIGIPKSNLIVTAFEEDIETLNLWKKISSLPDSNIIPIGEKDNFWSMGDTGPCGPCAEIFYDHGPSIPGGPPGSVDQEGDRFVEIWNIVFTQYDKKKDGSFAPLITKCVDTGIGLERLLAVLNGTFDNYQTGYFKKAIDFSIQKFGSPESKVSHRIIADHARAAAFLIADGLIPGNEDRNYVLRRIIRRASGHSKRFIVYDKPVISSIIPIIIDEFAAEYPELDKMEKFISEICDKEEIGFLSTLKRGESELKKTIDKSESIITGADLFKLYDTYGMPPDFAADVAASFGVRADLEGFENEMNIQKERSRISSNYQNISSVDSVYQMLADMHLPSSISLSLEKSEEPECNLLAIAIPEKGIVEHVESGEIANIVLDRTPFYAEGGGQVGDTGYLKDSSQEIIAEVINTKKSGNLIVHSIIARKKISSRMKIDACVDQIKRNQTAANHTATHLLHAALKIFIDKHCSQKGSFVSHEKLRFDFNADQKLSDNQIMDIEIFVNKIINMDIKVESSIMSIEDAIASGAEAIFGEKYSNYVRCLKIGSKSFELCGGTHVEKTSNIGCFVVTMESSIASGIRRIEAITGLKAAQYLLLKKDIAGSIVTELGLKTNSSKEECIEAISSLKKRAISTEKELLSLKIKLKAIELEKEGETFSNILLMVHKLLPEEASVATGLCSLMTNNKTKTIIVIFWKSKDKTSLTISTSHDLENWPQKIAKYLNIKGGGTSTVFRGSSIQELSTEIILGTIKNIILGN